MRQCINGHQEITWYDDGSQCPVCELKEVLTKLTEENENLKSTIQDYETSRTEPEEDDAVIDFTLSDKENATTQCRGKNATTQ